MGQQRGCIIGRGTWYSSGTCATFRAEKASGSSPSHKNKATLTLILTLTDDTFTLSSRKGPCAFKNDILTCNSKISNPVEFSVSHSLPIAEPKWSTISVNNRPYRPRTASFLTTGTQPSSRTRLQRAKCKAMSLSRRGIILSSCPYHGDDASHWNRSNTFFLRPVGFIGATSCRLNQLHIYNLPWLFDDELSL